MVREHGRPELLCVATTLGAAGIECGGKGGEAALAAQDDPLAVDDDTLVAVARYREDLGTETLDGIGTFGRCRLPNLIHVTHGLCPTMMLLSLTFLTRSTARPDWLRRETHSFALAVVSRGWSS